MATEHTGLVTFQGGALTLVGDAVAVGDPAPAFTIGSGLADLASLSDYAGKVVVLNVVPSLDTPVCDVQTRRFNEIATGAGDNVVVLTISMDLPPAQARWCGAADAENVVCLSDYRDHSFGHAYGVYIKEIAILARSVWVIDGPGVVQYKQIVPETVDEPDYDAAVAAVEALA
ncbi:thiol peroxidase [Candidatus Poribacteria bacterium]|jgi:thioredoxin-dependent peroxiredoxin|nr:thiol peroxidase [Candidatus Poribacteria bacterium]MBT5535151.1 thiol peroxidase [Candidatus Poribacteria bacterium]MBT5713513.1 thiol peroxidase [Candidatus Poribacteria bacterium]MBT7098663.1 thiol peroxidase [Candidatus Poribacteria bacterium]MBT7806017.1 thiol peroxidase [Candidatus Poribacteria bacterium]